MGYPDVTYRSELDPVVRKELEQLLGQFQGFLSSAGFKSDGSFETATATTFSGTSVTTENLTVTGTMDVATLSGDILKLDPTSTYAIVSQPDSSICQSGTAAPATTVWMLTATAPRKVYGIYTGGSVGALTVGLPGQVLVLVNNSSHIITFDGKYGVTTALRLYGCDPPVALDAGGIIAFWYDGANLGWRRLAVSTATPAGTIAAWAGASAPTGWLLCDGTEYPQAVYVGLYDVCSTTYNTGGETAGYFRVPDLRQRFVLGKAAAGTGSTLGGTFGAIDHTHTVPNTSTQGDHTHGVGTYATGNESSHTHGVSGNTGNAGAHTHSTTVAAMGVLYDGGSVNDPAAPGSYSSDDPGDHAHSISLTSAAGSAHNHSLSGNSEAAGGHSHTIAATGTNNPPAMALNYIIKY